MIVTMKAIDEEALTIYTDGSSYQRPRRGGIGILFVAVDEAGHERIVDYPLPGYAGATNNQMELQACIEALKALVRGRVPLDPLDYKKIVVRTDSMYVTDNIYSARYVWPRNRWMSRDGNPVLNARLWKDLVRVANRAHRRVDFEWVKGHKRDPHNRAADKLAKQSAETQTGQSIAIVGVRRKKSTRPLQQGCVQMRGQRATIRIITDEFLRQQRMNKYMYEVMSKASEFRGCVDVVFSDSTICLRRGHTYFVRFNDDTQAPRVLACYREVPGS
jgi:ribonuclease HI